GASTAGASGVATACMVPRALARYSTVMPLGIQRIEAGMLASVSMPPLSSARLHSAIACTVPMWLCTRRRSRIAISQRPGASATKRGAMVAKYGALKQISRPYSQRPAGHRESRCQSFSDSLMHLAPEKRTGRRAHRSSIPISRRDSGRVGQLLPALVRACHRRTQLVRMEVVHRDELEHRHVHALEQVVLGLGHHAGGQRLGQLAVVVVRLEL